MGRSHLPLEIWTRIFSLLDSSSPAAFSQACKAFYHISIDPHARAQYLLNRYGKQLALYSAFKWNRRVLSPNVGRLMRKRGAGLPRFLVQWVDKEYHKADRGKRAVSIPLYVFFIQEGFEIYGSEADFKDDDVAKFERLLYSSTTTSSTVTATDDAIASIRTLLDAYAFCPVKGLGSPVDETVFLLSKLDVTLIPKLIANGLDLMSVNDAVLERVLWRQDLTDVFLQKYLDNGFALTPMCIKKGLQTSRPSTLAVLQSRVSTALLTECAKEALVDMLGPSSGRAWNWVPESAEFLISTFNISTDVIAQALYTHPDAPRLPNGGCPEFPATRSYMKSNPCPVWRWILKSYGPHHPFTKACFDDALSRAAADRDLHALHDEFLQSGVRFYPRHVKILACRLLHRDMTANALHLLQVLREQITDDRDAGILTDAERSEWLHTLRDEVVENDEWAHRMRTTQLEGGARGGAYRISRPPEDALRFLDEAREMVLDLIPPVPPIPRVDWNTVSVHPARRQSVKTWVKRMGLWWKEQCERGVWGVVDHVV
ncbi:uncharacterized protein SPPG_06802 [Spizellomyces punctatus DAOM BR117]|uniref:F-box domain-containing protein n=1 Tax=Spizellomyces punctatus (strain DAOM BR117) TaxID=645134 RepID=A0A0L0H9D9_SPIPD|nr:uncharacterized protein SPPG_06802 [Spizellomyces punctatus DAOM BR117]KNC97807.1 hypothetical protein SPPG_06802 [Spizellomyces punctatus DAOM BR117]|eukprot:XP_016605847.1 hypothetical protein SPPG_06802 [Spizellomyces punctatus DAOM BR117]